MHALHVQLLREKGPEWRIRKTFELCEEIQNLKVAAKNWKPETQP